MKAQLDGAVVALLVTDGFEQVEMTGPRSALEAVGTRTHLVAPGADRVRGWQHDKPGDEFGVDIRLEQARADEYDALVVPGGVRSPDKLRMNPRAVAFVRAFFDQGKPVAAICHGPWLIVEADAARGRRVTSYLSLQTDLRNAGGAWVDQAAVVDRGLVTSRSPADLDDFNRALIEQVVERRQAAAPHGA
jgi:protease I